MRLSGPEGDGFEFGEEFGVEKDLGEGVFIGGVLAEEVLVDVEAGLEVGDADGFFARGVCVVHLHARGRATKQILKG